jgi:hypothetical protein
MVRGELYAAAFEMGDKTWAKQILDNEPVVCVPANKSDDGDNVLLTLVASLLAIAVFGRFGRNQFLSRLNNRWQCELTAATDFATRVHCLNKLIDLELFRKDRGQAERYSLDLMRVCGV